MPRRGRTPRAVAGWRAAHALLTARAARIPALVRDGPPLPEVLAGVPLADVGAFVVTGAGSSGAHARVLATLLADAVGVRARAVPPSSFVAPPPGDAAARARDVLVVFSQGLAPNARLALATARAWRHVVLVTAATRAGAEAAGKPEKAGLLAALAAAGVETCTLAGAEEEYGTLLRVIGPMLGHRAALAIARTVARRLGRADAVPAVDGAVVAAALAAAPGRLARQAWARRGLGTAPLVLVTSGGYGALVENLRAKVLEGLLRSLPPVVDVLDVAHGPFQQAWAGRATFVALTRPDATGEDDALGRLARMLHPRRHRLIRLAATLPGPLALFEHEALMNALVLRGIAAGRIDQARWPGAGRDEPLYALGADARPPRRSRTRRPAVAPSPAALARLVWPEVAARLAAGPVTAVVPLGSTEQHGPHLPFATDTWIADALAARFCARVPEAVALPALPLGCAAEHRAFPGTLDLRVETLEAVLHDVVAALAHHGFARAFLFSAHGGNAGPLGTALAGLRAAARGMPVDACTDLDAVTAALHAAAAGAGVGGGAAGHHAGETETSILLGLAPGEVRTEALAPGRTDVPGDPQALFYPSLRDAAPAGVVGDPTHADAVRAERYLDAWVDVLVAEYRRAKKRQ